MYLSQAQTKSNHILIAFFTIEQKTEILRISQLLPMGGEKTTVGFGHILHTPVRVEEKENWNKLGIMGIMDKVEKKKRRKRKKKRKEKRTVDLAGRKRSSGIKRVSLQLDRVPRGELTLYVQD